MVGIYLTTGGERERVRGEGGREGRREVGREEGKEGGIDIRYHESRQVGTGGYCIHASLVSLHSSAVSTASNTSMRQGETTPNVECLTLNISS